MPNLPDLQPYSIPDLARQMTDLGFALVATHGTARYLQDAGIECQGVNKVREGRPHVVDMIKNGEIHFIVNTTEGRQSIRESHSIRREALNHKVTYYTTIAAGKATCVALQHADVTSVNRLQDLHQEFAGEKAG